MGMTKFGCQAISLTGTLRDSVERDGFAVIPNVFQCPEINNLIHEMKSAQAHRSRAGMRHLMALPGISALANGVRLIAMASEILGAPAIPFRATLFDKSPDSNWLVAWHQDTALPLRVQREVVGWGAWSVKEGIHYAHAPTAALERVIALRVHLDDSTEENGPLRVILGSHLKGVLTDDQVHQLAEKSFAVNCLVRSGGVIAMRPLLIHASSKARSMNPRRVIHIEYAETLDIGDGFELAIA